MKSTKVRVILMALLLVAVMAIPVLAGEVTATLSTADAPKAAGETATVSVNVTSGADVITAIAFEPVYDSEYFTITKGKITACNDDDEDPEIGSFAKATETAPANGVIAWGDDIAASVNGEVGYFVLTLNKDLDKDLDVSCLMTIDDAAGEHIYYKEAITNTITFEGEAADVSDMEALFNAFAAQFVCPTHNNFHCKLQKGGSCTAENIVALFELGLDELGVDYTGYTVSVNAGEVSALKDAFGGEGFGSGASRDITFTITRDEDGVADTRVIRVSALKGMPWMEPLGLNYALGICPEDSAAIRKNINGIISRTLEEALDENECLPVETEDDVLAILGLDDAYGAIVDFGDGTVTITIYDALYVPFMIVDPDEGALPNETFVTVEYDLPAAADVTDIEALFDAFTAAFVCPTHGDFHCKISYGSKCAPETLVALFELGLDTIGEDYTGYTVSVDAGDVASLKNDFGGQGAGSGAWGEVDFTITRDEDGASVTKMIEVSALKAYPWLDIVGADYALGICPEDSAAIRKNINAIIGRTLEEALDDNDCLPVATEEDVLAILDLDDAYGAIVEFGDGIVTITIYDAMYIPFIEDDADEGHLDNETYVTVEYDLPAAADVTDIEALFDAFASKFVCPTHNQYHCILGYSFTCCGDTFEELMNLSFDAIGVDLTGYTVSASDTDADDLKNGRNGQGWYAGEGEHSAANGNIAITITRDADGASVTKTFQFHCVKDPYGCEERGINCNIYICPEDSAVIRREINGILQNTMEEALDEDGLLPAGITEDAILAILDLDDAYTAEIEFSVDGSMVKVTVYDAFYPVYTFDANCATFVTEEYDIAQIVPELKNGWFYDNMVYFIDDVRVTSWFVDPATGNLYFFNAEGVKLTNCTIFKTAENCNYVADANGVCTKEAKNGWFYDNKVYFENDVRVTGWKEIEGNLYFFNADGVKLVSTQIYRSANDTTYNADANGVCTPDNLKQGWQYEGRTYYVDGVRLTGWQEIEGNLYFFNAEGVKLVNTDIGRAADGKIYHADADGICLVK